MLHLNIWYVNIIEIMKGVGNGKKISICRTFGIEKSLFTLEDLYGLKITELDEEVCLHLDKGMGTNYITMFEMFTAWKEQAEKLKNGEITKEEYDNWRYNYPKNIKV